MPAMTPTKMPMGLPFCGTMPKTVSSVVQVMQIMKSVNSATKPV